MKKLLFLLIGMIINMSNLHGWSALDTLQIKEIGKIAISPNEEKVAYEVMTPIVNEEKGFWQVDIYLTQIANKETFKIGLKDYIPNSLEWFPDGKSFLFLTKTNNRTQLSRFFIVTGKIETLLDDEKFQITSIYPSHDGKSVAFLSLHKPKANPTFEIADEIVPKNKLYLFNILSKNSELVFDRDFSVGSLSWSPNDEYIAFDHQASTNVEDKMVRSKISKVHLPSRTITPITDDQFSNFNPQYSPDGKKIAYVSGPGTWEFAFHVKMFDEANHKTIAMALTPDEQVELVGWLGDSQSLLVAERYHTTQRLYTLSANEFKAITPLDSLILQPKISPKSNLIAYRGESATQPAEAYITPIPFDPIQISNVQTAKEYPKLNTQIISWTTSDGKVIEGLLTLPTDKVNRPYPLLVLVRGHSSLYLNTYEGGIHLAKTPYSIGVFADQGYAVLRPFFRGGSGYGRKMRDSIRGDWGGKDFEDLIEGIDFLVKQGTIDPRRMGIMGWSYGGFMSATAVTKTGLFKAASAGGAVVDFVSYAATTDIPHFLPYYMNGWYWDNPQTWKDHSPIEHVDKIKTPTLIQHSAGDKRVPVSQAQELYYALKYRNIPTKLIIYSDTGHSLNNPKVIVEGIQHNVDWFNTYLK